MKKITKIFLFLVGLFSVAYAQIHPATIGVITSVSRSSLLLDNTPNPSAVYSLRKLRTGYNGFAITVRATTTGAEADVAFDVTGWVSTSSTVTVTVSGTSGFSVGQTMAFSSFYGSQTVTVRRWYDQSVNGFNLNQSNSSRQPRIVSAGTLETRNSKPSIFFISDGLNTLESSSASISYTTSAIFFVFSRGGTADRGVFYHMGGSVAFNLYSDSNTSLRYEVGNTGTYQTTFRTISTNTLTAISGVGNESRLNGGSLLAGGGSGIINATVNAPIVIGEYAGYWDGNVSELIIYGSTPNSTIRAAIETSQVLNFGL